LSQAQQGRHSKARHSEASTAKQGTARQGKAARHTAKQGTAMQGKAARHTGQASIRWARRRDSKVLRTLRRHDIGLPTMTSYKAINKAGRSSKRKQRQATTRPTTKAINKRNSKHK